MKRILASLILAVLALSGPALAADPTAISVSGTGSISMLPDEATVNASVVTNATTANAAIAQNNDLYEKIVASAMNAGAKRDDIALGYYNVNYVAKPNPPPPPQPYDRWGYTVTRSFAIKVHAIDRSGAMVDAISAAGATDINGVSFGLAKPDNARHAATDKAMTDAHAKAVDLARAAGLHIVGIKSIDLENAGGIVRPLVMRAMAVPAPTAAPTEFDPGNVNVTVNVTVVFLASP